MTVKWLVELVLILAVLVQTTISGGFIEVLFNSYNNINNNHYISRKCCESSSGASTCRVACNSILHICFKKTTQSQNCSFYEYTSKQFNEGRILFQNNTADPNLSGNKIFAFKDVWLGFFVLTFNVMESETNKEIAVFHINKHIIPTSYEDRKFEMIEENLMIRNKKDKILNIEVRVYCEPEYLPPNCSKKLYVIPSSTITSLTSSSTINSLSSSSTSITSITPSSTITSLTSSSTITSLTSSSTSITSITPSSTITSLTSSSTISSLTSSSTSSLISPPIRLSIAPSSTSSIVVKETVTTTMFYDKQSSRNKQQVNILYAALGGSSVFIILILLTCLIAQHNRHNRFIRKKSRMETLEIKSHNNITFQLNQYEDINRSKHLSSKESKSNCESEFPTNQYDQISGSQINGSLSKVDEVEYSKSNGSQQYSIITDCPPLKDVSNNNEFKANKYEKIERNGSSSKESKSNEVFLNNHGFQLNHYDQINLQKSDPPSVKLDSQQGAISTNKIQANEYDRIGSKNNNKIAINNGFQENEYDKIGSSLTKSRSQIEVSSKNKLNEYDKIGKNGTPLKKSRSNKEHISNANGLNGYVDMFSQGAAQ